jgi:alkylation response protein AidB-like acyl-CoA dehydrogenase
VIGEIDQGFVYMMQRLVAERIGSAVNNIAHARQILDETLAYVKERKAFGTPVGSHQANKFTLAELQTLAEVTQAFVDQCVMEAVHGKLTAVDAAKAKWWSAQAQNDILDACVQLWGGYGYMNEYRVARAWSDARASKIWAGSNEIMKELIGRDLGL